MTNESNEYGPINYPTGAMGDFMHYVRDVPQDQQQYEFQMGLADFFPMFNSFYRNRDRRNYTLDYMRTYGLDFSDMRYPTIGELGYGSGVSGSTFVGGLANIGRGLMAKKKRRHRFNRWRNYRGGALRTIREGLSRDGLCALLPLPP